MGKCVAKGKIFAVYSLTFMVEELLTLFILSTILLGASVLHSERLYHGALGVLEK